MGRDEGEGGKAQKAGSGEIERRAGQHEREVEVRCGGDEKGDRCHAVDAIEHKRRTASRLRIDESIKRGELSVSLSVGESVRVRVRA